MQAKLLRVLQPPPGKGPCFREFTPAGGTKTTQSDVRIIAATNRNRLDDVNAGRFREDLFYRLAVIKLKLPPLSDRKTDIPALVDALREAHNVGRWLYVIYADGRAEECPAFTDPPQGGIEAATQRREKRAVMERIAAQEAQMQKLLADLEQERAGATQAKATAEERQAALEAALKAKNALQALDPLAFSEAETRAYLIDQMLADEGWDVGKGMTDTEEVRNTPFSTNQQNLMKGLPITSCSMTTESQGQPATPDLPADRKTATTSPSTATRRSSTRRSSTTRPRRSLPGSRSWKLRLPMTCKNWRQC